MSSLREKVADYSSHLLSEISGIETYKWAREEFCTVRFDPYEYKGGDRWTCGLFSVLSIACPALVRFGFRGILNDRSPLYKAHERSNIPRFLMSLGSDLSSIIYPMMITSNIYQMTNNEIISLSAGVFTKLSWNTLVHTGVDVMEKIPEWRDSLKRTSDLDKEKKIR